MLHHLAGATIQVANLANIIAILLRMAMKIQTTIKQRLYYSTKINKYFESKFMNIFLFISLNVSFGCSKEQYQ